MLYLDVNLPLASLPDVTFREHMKDPEKQLCGNVTCGVPKNLSHV